MVDQLTTDCIGILEWVLIMVIVQLREQDVYRISSNIPNYRNSLMILESRKSG